MILNVQNGFLVDECHDERNEITTRSVLYLEDNAVAAFVRAGWVN